MRTTLQIPMAKPEGTKTDEWVSGIVSEIIEAAREDAAIDAAGAFTIDHSGYTELETFDPATVTLEELARAFATLIKYVQSHGPRKE